MATAKIVGKVDLAVVDKAMEQKETEKRNRQRNATFRDQSLHIRVQKSNTNLKHSPFAGLKGEN